ncbi:unnamed protein product [Trifolium pratense]|uniref:Uncharacterized protein n=1 Tax=Trifolium pratense TaxID=57577 RepID=A0ACB0IZT7_TRIPR|nr:unnamed protein product [Trifolium pratense]
MGRTRWRECDLGIGEQDDEFVSRVISREESLGARARRKARDSRSSSSFLRIQILRLRIPIRVRGLARARGSALFGEELA